MSVALVVIISCVSFVLAADLQVELCTRCGKFRCFFCFMTDLNSPLNHSGKLTAAVPWANSDKMPQSRPRADLSRDRWIQSPEC